MIQAPFVQYTLIAALFWGFMGVSESVAGQANMYGALCVKYALYGIGGTAFLVLLLGGWSALKNHVVEFVHTHPRTFVIEVVAVLGGLVGTYFMYKAFRCCGSNKALAVIISYCVPVIVVAILSYVFLKERFNKYAILGVLLILTGVICIDYYGIDDEPRSTHTKPVARKKALQKAATAVLVD